MRARVKHLFLDLEDTVITPVVEGWNRFELMNTQKVRDFIEQHQPDHVHLFSFALHSERDLCGFNQFVRPVLENELGRRIEAVPLMTADILPACCRVQKLHPERVDLMDMTAFWGKHEAFRFYVRDRFSSVAKENPIHVVLIDDVVINETFEWPDQGIAGRIIDINTI